MLGSSKRHRKGNAIGDLVDTLIESAGLYVGLVEDMTHPDDERKQWNARIVVTPLPGKTAVSLDYECLSQEHGRFHSEHSVLGRTPKGLVMVVAHPHGTEMLVLREDEPGRFIAGPGDSSFPVALEIEASEKGRILHRWLYAPPGQEIVLHDVADVRLLT